MEYHSLKVEINPWEGRSYEIIARLGQDQAAERTEPAGSARQVAAFPLSPAGLEGRLPALRRALGRVDLGAGRGSGEEDRAVEEFALLFYRFIFSGEVRRLLEEERAAAVREWRGLRLVLYVTAPDLQALPWEVLWDILAFDLQSMKRGLFDLRVERPQPRPLSANVPLQGPGGRAPLRGPGDRVPLRGLGSRAPTGQSRPTISLHPTSIAEHHLQAVELVRQADIAFYSPDFAKAVMLYEAGLRFDPSLRQARESLLRAQAGLLQREPHTTVPPRAAAGYRRAWETYTMYRFDEALRWLNEAWLLAKDWGIAEWPEAHDFHALLERSRAAFANYQEALFRAEDGDLQGALEAIDQAYRADPLEVYRAQREDWGQVFSVENE